MVKDNTKHLFLAPALDCVLCFTVIMPFLQEIIFPFRRWDGFSVDIQSLGLENYKNVLTDRIAAQH